MKYNTVSAAKDSSQNKFKLNIYVYDSTIEIIDLKLWSNSFYCNIAFATFTFNYLEHFNLIGDDTLQLQCVCY